VRTKYLIHILFCKTSSSESVTSKSIALHNLNTIKSWVSNKNGVVATKEHKVHLETLIAIVLKVIK
jgi:hypothetical protein